MRLGVVVLTYEPGETVVETLRVLQTSARRPDDIIVVDNASSARSLEPLQSALPEQRILRLPSNDGYGPAMNAGAEDLGQRGNDLLLFLTQEATLDPQAVGRLETHLAVHPTTGVAGPLLCRRSMPDQVWSAGGARTDSWHRPRHLANGTLRSAVADAMTAVDWLDGACLLTRRSVFEAVGGFREDLFLYLEDVDFCHRIRAAGHAVTCVTGAVAWQEPSMTPPYLAARNRSLVLGPSGVVLETLARTIADPVRGRGLRPSLLAWRGIRDARSRRLDRDRAMVRP